MGGHRMVPSADEHFYCATQYAVTALTEGLRQELREAKTHIRATVNTPNPLALGPTSPWLGSQLAQRLGLANP